MKKSEEFMKIFKEELETVALPQIGRNFAEEVMAQLKTAPFPVEMEISDGKIAIYSTSKDALKEESQEIIQRVFDSVKARGVTQRIALRNVKRKSDKFKPKSTI